MFWYNSVCGVFSLVIFSKQYYDFRVLKGKIKELELDLEQVQGQVQAESENNLQECKKLCSDIKIDLSLMSFDVAQNIVNIASVFAIFSGLLCAATGLGIACSVAQFIRDYYSFWMISKDLDDLTDAEKKNLRNKKIGLFFGLALNVSIPLALLLAAKTFAFMSVFANPWIGAVIIGSLFACCLLKGVCSFWKARSRRVERNDGVDDGNKAEKSKISLINLTCSTVALFLDTIFYWVKGGSGQKVMLASGGFAFCRFASEIADSSNNKKEEALDPIQDWMVDFRYASEVAYPSDSDELEAPD